MKLFFAVFFLATAAQAAPTPGEYDMPQFYGTL